MPASGSDPGIFRGKQTFGPRPFPIIMGHEIVGRIAAMGRGARERHGVVITHTFPLAQAERAVRLVAGEIEGEAALKVVIDPKG